MPETPEQKRARVKAEAQRRIAAGYIQDDDELDRFMTLNGVGPLGSDPAPTTEQPKPDATKSWLQSTFGAEARAAEKVRDRNDLKAIASNLPLADDVMGVVTALRGQGVQKGRNWVAESRKEAEEAMGESRYGLMSSIPTMATAAGAMMVGQPTYAARVAAPALVEGLRRFTQAGSSRPNMPTMGERADEAVSGFGSGLLGALTGETAFSGAGWAGRTVLPQVSRFLLKNPVAGPITKAAEASIRGPLQAMGRATSNFVGRTLGEDYGGGLARFLEPKDKTYLTRVVDEAFPGTAGSAPLGRFAIENERAKSGVEEARGLLGLVDKHVKTIPGAVGEVANPLIASMEAKAAQRGMAATEELEGVADDLVTRLKNPATDAKALKAEVKKSRDAKATVLYDASRNVAPPQAVPQKLYDLIDSDADLRAAYTQTKRELRAKLTMNAAKGVPVTSQLPRIRPPMNPVIRQGQPAMEPKLSLELFDNMKRKVNERVKSYLSTGNGVAPAKGIALKQRIEMMEDDFLNMHAPADRDLLLNARAQYRKDSEVLDAIADGSNLMSLKVPKNKATGGPNTADDYLQYINGTYGKNPEAMEAFRAAGQRAIRVSLERGGDRAGGSALIERLVGSDAGRQRLAMVYGDDLVKGLETLRPDQIAATVKERIAPLLERIPKIEAAAANRVTRLTGDIESRRPALNSLIAGRERAAENIGQLNEIPFERALSGQGNQPAETLGKYTFPGLSATQQDRARDAAGSIVKSEMQGMTPSEIMVRLGELKENPASKALFGSTVLPNKTFFGKDRIGTVAEGVLEQIRKPGPVREGVRRVRAAGFGRLGGGIGESAADSGERIQRELDAIGTPAGFSGPVSSSEAASAAPSDYGVDDTTRIYTGKSGRRVVDTHQYPTIGSNGKTMWPTHAVEGTSGKKNGETWEEYERRTMDMEDWPTDVMAVNKSPESLRADFREPLEALLAAAKAEGVNFRVNEGLRSTDRQEYLFQTGRKPGRGTAKRAATWTLTSNHADSGAVDLRSIGKDGDEDPAAYQWLQKNAARFGLNVLGDNDLGHVEKPKSTRSTAARREPIPTKSSDVAQPWR